MPLVHLVELTRGALIPGRVFNIDDVILHTAGALVGYSFIGLRLGRAGHPRRRHCRRRCARTGRVAARPHGIRARDQTSGHRAIAQENAPKSISPRATATSSHGPIGVRAKDLRVSSVPFACAGS